MGGNAIQGQSSLHNSGHSAIIIRMYKAVINLLLCIVILLGPIGYRKIAHDSSLIAVPQQLQLKPAFHSRRLGFDIFDSAITDKLIDESRKQRVRYLQVTNRNIALPKASGQYRRLWRLDTAPVSSTGIPDVMAVGKIIESMDLPDNSLRGVKIFIVPYSLSRTSGLSYPNVILIGSRPDDVDSIDTQLEFTVAHEVGHILHYRYMGEKAGNRWKKYMKLRGIERWTVSGAAGSRRWAESVEETFAEDARIVLGNKKSAFETLSTRYPDPRADAVLFRSLDRFFSVVFRSKYNDSRTVTANIKEVFNEANSEYI